MLIYTHAGPEIAVASTKAYMVQIAVMYLFAFELALAVGKIDETECAVWCSCSRIHPTPLPAFWNTRSRRSISPLL